MIPEISPKELHAVITTPIEKNYDGSTDITLEATVKIGALGQSYTISGLKGSFADANAGTGKPVTVDSSEARVETGESAVNLQNYLITYPAQTGTIHRRQGSVSIDTEAWIGEKTYGDDSFPLTGVKKVGDGVLNYTSSDEKVLTVDAQGQVTIKGTGSADVSITMAEGTNYLGTSTPVKGTPIARLSAFVNEVETHSPFRKKMLPEVSAMFTALAPYAGFGMKLVFGNLWLFGPLLKAVMPSLSAQAGAMLKTTIAFTVQKGSDAYNVLPQEAYVGANMRFIPHQGEKESLEIIKKVAGKYGLETEVLHANDYTPPVDIHGEAFHLVEQTIADTFPGLPSSPYVMTGATDAQFYQPICKSCIRFAPVIYGPEQMKGMHGLNENIEYNCLPGAVRFYKNLIRAEK